MSVAGLCEVCETREVVGACERCGTLVCERHLNEETNYCTSCYAEVYGGRSPDDGTRGRPREERPDGVEEYRF